MTNQIQFTPVVHTLASGEAGLMVNGYLIETSKHVVAVDSALIESAAKDLRQKFDALGKPLAFVLVTVGHKEPLHTHRRASLMLIDQSAGICYSARSMTSINVLE